MLHVQIATKLHLNLYFLFDGTFSHLVNYHCSKVDVCFNVFNKTTL